MSSETSITTQNGGTMRFVDYAELPHSPRSQVLNNSDLTELIFSFFVVPANESNTSFRITAPHSQHLLWASLTSKAFFAPAMNILWQSMNSWTILLKLIPPLEVVRRESKLVYSTKAAIHKDELQRLTLYAGRIRNLEITAFDHFVSTHIYAGISHFYPTLFPVLSRLLIPNLQELHHDNLNALFLMSVPTLSTVSIGGIGPATEMFAATLLMILSNTASFLEVLDISGELSDATLTHMDVFKQLKTLHLGLQRTVLDRHVMEKISGISSLEYFSIKMDEHSTFNCTSRLNTGFTTLESFSLTGPMNAVFSILGKVDMSKVQDIALYCHGPEMGTPLIQESLRTILRPQVASSLQSFCMDVVAGLTVSYKVLIPLQTCSHLQHLSMSIEYLDSARLRQLCSNQGWINLSTLRLACNRAPLGWTGLSLEDLRTFAENCPNLTSLAISLETIVKELRRMKEMLKESIENKVVPKAILRQLHILPLASRPNDITQEVSQKNIRDAVAISQYLHSLFPQLDNLLYPNDSDWFGGVADMLKAYQAIRN